jgi:hypothetical protein
LKYKIPIYGLWKYNSSKIIEIYTHVSKKAIDKIRNPVDDFLIDQIDNNKGKIYTIAFSPPIWWNKHNRVYTNVGVHCKER